ncbi:MAG TPA: class I SAM-dependent methyltransferase [Gammaproteobacteria bacterium]|nr:class I SAM-dependent methyltransferase [Gammaproteobacteria bacterium]
MKKHKTPDMESNIDFFIPTLNNTGYVLSKLDDLSLAFIEYASSTKDKALEIGAGFGFVVEQALSRNIEIYCNDIEPKHIEIINQLANNTNRHLLTTVCGQFPEQVDFPDNFFSAILISRVIHLFPGEAIEASFKKIFRWLKPSGKAFIVADTPYLRNFEKFISKYEQRVQKGEKWPGLILDTSKYLDKHRALIPSLVHFMDEVVLKRVLIESGFEIKKLYLMNRIDYPENRRFDGRESVGVIAQKP